MRARLKVPYSLRGVMKTPMEVYRYRVVTSCPQLLEYIEIKSRDRNSPFNMPVKSDFAGHIEPKAEPYSNEILHCR